MIRVVLDDAHAGGWVHVCVEPWLVIRRDQGSAMMDEGVLCDAACLMLTPAALNVLDGGGAPARDVLCPSHPPPKSYVALRDAVSTEDDGRLQQC